MEFSVKHDGRHRAILVAGEHIIKELEYNFYLGVVELENIKILFVAADLIKLKVISSDVGSANIQEFTREKIFAVEGPEFGKWAGLKLSFSWHCMT